MKIIIEDTDLEKIQNQIEKDVREKVEKALTSLSMREIKEIIKFEISQYTKEELRNKMEKNERC